MIYRIALVLTAFFALYVVYMGYGVYQSWAAQKAVFEASDSTVIGPADAPLTVVKFMDYACPHCREIHPPLIQALREDGQTRLIVRPLPSQSPDGSRAARVAYAAARLGKFGEAHEYIITHFGSIDDAFLEKTAEAMGVSREDLVNAIADKSTDAAVWENLEMFKAMGGRVTPTFFIGPGRVFIPQDGLPGPENFKAMFADARAAAK